jgi:pimeloyl-ACP methyl ester carboxylesterase
MRKVNFDRRKFMAGGAALGAGTLAACSQTTMNGMGAQTATATGLGVPSDPATRQGRMIEVNGARIFVEMSGNGPPMVLLHGYPLSGALFARVRDRLSERFTLITLDHRGYGKSQAPGVPDQIATYAQDALEVIRQIGLSQAHIAGMSMGGPIVFEMYQRAPDMFSSLMLIDTIAAPASPAEAGLWRGVAEMVRQGGIDAIIPQLLPEMLTGQARRDRPELVNYLQAVMKNASRDAAIGGALALAGRPDYQPLLGQISVPTLILIGLQDTVYPLAIAQRMQRMIPGAQLSVIDNGSHAVIFELPAEAAQAILSFYR